MKQKLKEYLCCFDDPSFLSYDKSCAELFLDLLSGDQNKLCPVFTPTLQPPPPGRVGEVDIPASLVGGEWWLTGLGALPVAVESLFRGVSCWLASNAAWLVGGFDVGVVGGVMTPEGIVATACCACTWSNIWIWKSMRNWGIRAEILTQTRIV